MKKQRKQRSREEIVAILAIVKSEYNHNVKYNHPKIMEYYRNRIGLRVPNEFLEKYFTGEWSEDHLIDESNLYFSGHYEEVKKNRELRQQLRDKITDIVKFCRENSKLFSCELTANADTTDFNVCGQPYTIKNGRTVYNFNIISN